MRRPLADAWVVRFEAAAPVREFHSYRGQRHLPGRWWSSTVGGHIGYESWLERDHLMLLDFDPSVVGISSQPFWLFWTSDKGKGVSHAPDYFARRDDGSALVVDVGRLTAASRRRPDGLAGPGRNPGRHAATARPPTRRTHRTERVPLPPLRRHDRQSVAADQRRRGVGHRGRQRAHHRGPGRRPVDFAAGRSESFTSPDRPRSRRRRVA
ncbi:TnsA-like heteromeric transposase endonuclease subunit [Streptomyces sp. NPDC059112]